MKSHIFLILSLLFTCCIIDGDIENLNQNKKVVISKKKFNYFISKSISDTDNKTINSNLSKKYDIKIEFIDSIDLEKFKFYIISSSTKDTIYKTTSALEFQPTINQYGSYDILFIPSKLKENEKLDYFYSDTIKIKNFIKLSYQEDWSGFQNSNGGNWQGNSFEGASIKDIISNVIKYGFENEYQNFNSCNELRVLIKYYIDQKNRVQNQILTPRPFFDVLINNTKFKTITNGIDSEEKQIQLDVNNIPESFNIKIDKYSTFLKSNWKIIPGYENTIIGSDSLYKIAYDTLKVVGFPQFSRNENFVSKDSLVLDFFGTNLYYKILNQSPGGDLLYGIRRGQFELNGDSILFGGIEGYNKISMILKSNKPIELKIENFQSFNGNDLQFNLNITSLTIECN